MSSENTEENAQGGNDVQSYNEYSEIEGSTLNNMDISDSDNASFVGRSHLDNSKEHQKFCKAGLESMKKDSNPLGNAKTSKGGDGNVDENLIIKVGELAISENNDKESVEAPSVQAEAKMSLSFETFLKLGSRIPDNSATIVDTNVRLKRIGLHNKRDDEEESVDSDLDSESESEDYDSEEEAKAGLKAIQNMNKKKRKVQDESWLSVLGRSGVPDISSLGLNNKEEFMHMGILECVIDKIVTIAGLPELPAYDLDTLLFLEEGQKVLGYIFDVMGPVSAPVYIVQMDSKEAIKNHQLQKGTFVYCAPKSKYTKYVFLQELMKTRGSDAGWLGEGESPSNIQEFSDDEPKAKESKVSRSERMRQHSQERQRKFVADMNRANERDTRLHRMADTHRLHMERASGAKNIDQQLREHRLRNQRSGNSNHSVEARRGRSHFRNNSFGVGTSLSEPQSWGGVVPVDIGDLLHIPPSCDPSSPPPNVGATPRLFVPPGGNVFPSFFNYVPPNFTPRGVDSNRSTSRSNLRQNSMPGPSNEGWFN